MTLTRISAIATLLASPALAHSGHGVSSSAHWFTGGHLVGIAALLLTGYAFYLWRKE